MKKLSEVNIYYTLDIKIKQYTIIYIGKNQIKLYQILNNYFILFKKCFGKCIILLMKITMMYST